MKKKLFFLSGLPRSGSTVLSAILNQHPDVYVSITSGLSSVLGNMVGTWESEGVLKKNDVENKRLFASMASVIDGYHEDIDKPIIIDKSRTWPEPVIMRTMSKVLKEPVKIIATVRNVPDCMASFIRVAQPENIEDYVYHSSVAEHLKQSYLSLMNGWKEHPDNILFVSYEDMLSDSRKEMLRIQEFLELTNFDYDFDNINPSLVKEDDEVLWGIKGLHDIKPKLEKQHNQTAMDVLKHHHNLFHQQEFWNKNKPHNPILDDLDLQVEASTKGDFKEGWRLSEKLSRERPGDSRSAYNKAWYLFREGNLKEAYRLFSHGRKCKVVCSENPNSPAPEWDGVAKGTILLYLNHGLGDQIHQARYAKDLISIGNKVIICCSGQLVALLSSIKGVSAVVQHGAEFGIFHEYWAHGMLFPSYLGYELKDISGYPYLPRQKLYKRKIKRIGLRWQGSLKSEGQQHKHFPFDLMFNAVRGLDYDFISLQRDEGTEACPLWVKKVSLETWLDTKNAVESCDLVISSCTSVSHLSAAMGIETWVIQPILPYYIYAMEGETTPYYDSMRLFRQVEFGKWEEPFKQIRERLESKGI